MEVVVRKKTKSLFAGVGWIELLGYQKVKTCSSLVPLQSPCVTRKRAENATDTKRSSSKATGVKMY